MTVEEVEKWTESEIGKKWLDGKKDGLLNKKNELLEEVAELKEKLKTATEKATLYESQVTNYKNSFRKDLIESAFKESGFIPISKTLNEFIFNEVQKFSGSVFDVVCDNEKRELKNENENFKDALKKWVESDEENKSFIKNTYSGGGATGSGSSVMTSNTLKNMSVEEVAKNFDKPDFQNALKTL